jgi:MoaA/NifB/PqqE/SkfB family radical SAM enzyme
MGKIMGESELQEMPFLRNIGFLITYKCQVACPHCIIEAGPHRKEEMWLNDALDWIAQASQYRAGYIKLLSLTGGEPFFNLDVLETITTFAQNKGFIVSAVTNAFWAMNPKTARTVLARLQALRMIAISTDVHHQQAIPFARVQNAILAAKELGIPYNVHVCTENENDPNYRKIIEQLSAITNPSTINTAVTFPLGRALTQIGMAKYDTTAEPPNSACAAAHTPIIFPDGRVLACIGPIIDLGSSHPLILGNLKHQRLQDILDGSERNTILHALRVWGPKRLISLAQEQGFHATLPSSYLKDSACFACYELMKSAPVVRFLEDVLAGDPDFMLKTAYARLYYLQEPQMLDLILPKQTGPRPSIFSYKAAQ